MNILPVLLLVLILGAYGITYVREGARFDATTLRNRSSHNKEEYQAAHATPLPQTMRAGQ